MTYTTTHLGVATFVIYYFSPASVKEYFRNRPVTFFLLSIGTIMPDLDLLTSGHRAYGHSVFFPLILLVISGYTARLGLKNQDIIFKLRYFSLFWLAHLIYDATFGPVAYFWPLDPRFYDVNMGVEFNLDGNFILPITISGLFVDIDIIDQTTGVRTFFVNWSAEERIAAFGQQFVNFSITDFMLHATLFVWYVIFVVFPVIKILLSTILSQLGSKSVLIRGFLERSPSYRLNNTFRYDQLKKYKRSFLLILFLLLLALSFFIAGPYYQKQWVDRSDSGSQFYILSSNIRLLGSKEYSVPQDSQFSVTVKSSKDSLNYSLFSIEVDKSSADQIQNNVSRLLDAYDDGNMSYLELVNSYQNYVATLDVISEENISQISIDSSATWQYEAEEDIIIISGLYYWNSSLAFITNIEYEAIWLIDRSKEYQSGLLLMTFVFSLALIESFMVVMKMKED